MRSRRGVIRVTLAALLALPLLALGTPPGARAQQSGLRPGGGTVRILLGSAPGSAADAVARAMAESLAGVLGQPVVMENAPGGGGVVAASRVMQSRRDGTTILSAVSGSLIGPMLDRSLPYEIGRDLIPVSQVTAAMAVFVVRASLPARTLAEYLAQAKASGEPQNFGNYGYGSSSHLQGLLLARSAGLAMDPVPYSGTTQLILDLTSGRLCCAFIDAGSAREFIRNGQLRPLAVTGPRRAPNLPEIPTFTELNIANFEPQIWQGMFLPSGTPDEIVTAVGRAMAEAITRPEASRVIRELDYESVGSSPAEFTAMIAHDAPIWRRIIEETGVRIK
ncbi:Bug family tripartite tricarboxylate transporter substrate binding protein [Roseomonas sp. BN140053]|uniref:Bug family tripartite tricarboxylate transporter substrate binding protein n=1 Tax=Roseomonas sp. BN140053 TaxID=3391898 RepID=UPI0039EA4AF3